MTPERFFARVMPVPFAGCWIWMGSIADKRGYGLVYLDETTRTGAHRYSWMLHHGAIPEGKMVCHTCDIPSCVNPSHLFLGTSEDNNKDSFRKGRSKQGVYQLEKTHCPSGHPYAGRNLILYQGRRYCRQCIGIRTSTWQKRKRKGSA